ncbi:hydantoinase B/oxoprolinase family protein [Tessaracoccus sp. SD287]|uniref:hydantoinase B/oxoprolinase family protein n=1 Tax=Tessaracoccus sp. SD287 TaxID=2782008 RepID=UPI001A9680F1|nr:hydantoinase B/oxoprolinase family protein [Tessaracoccus sp. SD287]MBO1031500.1 hydantoinase B/oxoprolinase family protein [Tessaracoccus sp. SD287]
MTATTDLQIIGAKLAALTEEMCLTLQRTSRSLYVKETADFACAIADRDGTFIAYPNAMGVSGFVGLNLATAIARVHDRDPLQPGDVIVTNDPFTTGGLSTHLPDIQMIEPYFVDGEIVAYGWAFVHISDIGGRVPSSVSPFNTSIFAEGLQIPPVKYVRGGQVVADINELLQRNTRTPDANEGDFQAMLGALATGRRRIGELAAREGTDAFLEASTYLLDRSAAKSRAALRSLGNGSYRAVDYLDSDAFSRAPVRISITVTLDDGHLSVDFAGTDPQVEAALNIASFGTTHAWLTTRILGLVMTLDPTMPLNGGLMRPVTLVAPQGSIVHADYPAATGVRHATASRVNDVLSAALIQVAPETLPAASSGLVVPVVVAETRGDRDHVQVVEPMVGGTGARLGADGVDGRDSGISNLANNPVETVESEVCVRVLRYALRPDSGGPGRWRGGTGLALTFEALRPCSLLARGMERVSFRPWGYAGGQPGLPTRMVINEGTDREQRPSIVDIIALQPGDTVTLLTSGAGGYGHPFERDITAVREDVARGKVSVEAAARDYGVVITGDGSVDLAATEERRLAPTCGAGETGPERERFDRVFETPTWDRMVERLFAGPVVGRNARKVQIIEQVLDGLPAGFPRTEASTTKLQTAARLFDALVADLTDGTDR